MVIFCVHTRERAKKPPNSDAYAQIEKKTFAREEKKNSRLFFSLYVYAYAQRNHSIIAITRGSDDGLR